MIVLVHALASQNCSITSTSFPIIVLVNVHYCTGTCTSTVIGKLVVSNFPIIHANDVCDFILETTSFLIIFLVFRKTCMTHHITLQVPKLGLKQPLCFAVYGFGLSSVGISDGARQWAGL